MGLNYTDGCVNFRDVGEYLTLILGREVLPENVLYRGGSIDHLRDLSEIKQAKSIFSLRNRADFQEFDCHYYHFPMANKVEKYDASQKEVRKWLNEIFKTFENPDLQYPVLIHCLSGKDRTGIVIALLLLTIGIEKEAVIEEYLLSEGEVDRKLISMAINGVGDLTQYFHRVNLDLVRKHILAVK